MKAVLGLVSILFAAHAVANTYIVDPMICRGKMLATSQAHPSYTELMQRFVSFYSTRRDGTRALSLETSNVYGEPGEVIPTTAEGQEVWYGAPLRLDGKKVSAPDIVGELDLTIVSSRRVRGKKIDTLRGRWMKSGDVVRGHGYELECEATVVARPSRVDDYTCRNSNCQ